MIKSTKASFLILAAALIFSLNTLLVKELTTSIDSFAITMIRFASGTAAGFLLLKFSGVPFRVEKKLIWSARGILGSIAMILYFKAIQMNGIAWSTLLVNTSAFFVALNGRLFFRQTLHMKTVVAMILAFTGILIIYFTSTVVSIPGTLVGLSVAFIRGFTAHLIKKSSQVNHPAIVYMAATLFGLLLFPLAWNEIRIQSVNILALSLLAGVIVFAAQVLFTAGLKHVTPDRSSLLLYSTIPMSLFIAFVRGEAMNLKFLIGSLFIIAGILMEVLLKENRTE